MMKDEKKTPTVPPESKVNDPKASFVDAVAKIDPSHLTASLSQTVEATKLDPELRLAGFLDCLRSLLSRVSFQWDDIFKDPVQSKLFQIDVSHIPEPVYKVLLEWINEHLPDDVLSEFVSWTYEYIIESVWKDCCEEGERRSSRSNVSIFVAAAMVLRSKPHVLTRTLGDLREARDWYEQEGALTTPLTVWMIAQAFKGDLLVALQSWAVILLPLFVCSNDQSKDLILDLVEDMSKKPDARTKLENDPSISLLEF